MKKLYFISKELSDFLYSDCFKHRLDLINLGVTVFQRNNSRFSGTECIFRAVQDGVINIVPYMTKRLVKSKNVELFKKFIMHRYNSYAFE
jgi:hypothetical protein